MPAFHYANPPVIHWGVGCARERLGEELQRLGARRVLLVTTRSAVRDPRRAPAVESLLGGRLAGRSGEVGEHAPARSVMEVAEALDAPTAADGVADLVAALDLPRRLSRWSLSEAELVEATRPLASPDHPEGDLLAILRAAL
jgi:alcohol dehydrogenase class IV